MHQTIRNAQDSGRDCPFLAKLECYLMAMADQIIRSKQVITNTEWLDSRIVSTRYKVTFTCKGSRLRRFMALMEEPYPEQFVLGRLSPAGSFQAFRLGEILFYNYLRSEDLLVDFYRDLTEAMSLYRLPQPHCHAMS